ncbi:MAG: PD-(D/E)XK nuclease-like domain-containing protein, partial [Oscillospiraceae bacterium]
YGVPWRIRMDKRIESPRIILDWKTSANIRDLTYNRVTKEWETFIEAHGYMMRAAVYSEIEKQNTGLKSDPMFLIAAVSKQDPPDKGLYCLNHKDRYLFELEKIKENLPRIMRVKDGSELPRKCGKCE